MKPSLRVRAVSDQDEDHWVRYVSSHRAATAYHDWAWRRIFKAALGYRSFYLVAESLKDDTWLGCLPLFVVGPRFFRRLVSVPFRDRGGLLWDTDEAFGTLVAAAEGLRERTRSSFVDLKSVASYPSELVLASGLTEHRYWVRSSVDLRGLDVATYRQRLGKKIRNVLRQAEGAGLTASDASDRPNALELWYPLHLATQRELGLPPFPQKFFSLVLQELLPRGAARLFVVLKGEKAVAAAIVLFEGRTGIYGYSASDPSARAQRPNDALLFHVVAWLIERGFECFDLGSDAPSQEGLLFFKRKWLAQQRPIPVYALGPSHPALVDSSAPRYALARAVFRRLPLPILRLTAAFTHLFG